MNRKNAVSTYQDCFVFTFNCYGAEEQYEAMVNFLSLLKGELYSLT